MIPSRRIECKLGGGAVIDCLRRWRCRIQTAVGSSRGRHTVLVEGKGGGNGAVAGDDSGDRRIARYRIVRIREADPATRNTYHMIPGICIKDKLRGRAVGDYLGGWGPGIQTAAGPRRGCNVRITGCSTLSAANSTHPIGGGLLGIGELPIRFKSHRFIAI